MLSTPVHLDNDSQVFVMHIGMMALHFTDMQSNAYIAPNCLYQAITILHMLYMTDVFLVLFHQSVGARKQHESLPYITSPRYIDSPYYDDRQYIYHYYGHHGDLH